LARKKSSTVMESNASGDKVCRFMRGSWKMVWFAAAVGPLCMIVGVAVWFQKDLNMAVLLLRFLGVPAGLIVTASSFALIPRAVEIRLAEDALSLSRTVFPGVKARGLPGQLQVPLRDITAVDVTELADPAYTGEGEIRKLATGKAGKEALWGLYGDHMLEIRFVWGETSRRVQIGSAHMRSSEQLLDFAEHLKKKVAMAGRN
jgi:hypothetical protein